MLCLRFSSAFVVTVVLTSVLAGYRGTTNQAGLDLIKASEGWYPNFYKDPVGIKTIGYGHACHVWDCSVPLNGKYYPPLTKVQGEQLLISDLRSPGRYEDCVKKKVTIPLNENQFSALVSFVFNLGCGSLHNSSLLKLLNKGDTKAASKEFSKWVHAGKKTLPGLVIRREAERKLFCKSGGCGGSSPPSNSDRSSSCVGTVTSESLRVRKSPTTSSPIVSTLSKGDKVDISEKIKGQTIFGNRFWFKVKNGYVSAYYVDLAPSRLTWCKE